jgi:hypothetical protein
MALLYDFSLRAEIAYTIRGGKKVRISQKDGTTEERGDMVEPAGKLSPWS